MAHTTNNYDKLYMSMKENLTVANSDCTLGEYMLMEPEKDTVIRSFPLRTAAAAFLCAVVASTFILSIGLLGTKIAPKKISNIQTLNASETEVVETEDATANIAE